MVYLVSKYNKYIEKVAPEIGEEVILSPRIQKYILIRHYEEGTIDTQTIGNAKQLVMEFMLSIAFHVGNSPDFKNLLAIQRKEKIRQAILKEKEMFISLYYFK